MLQAYAPPAYGAPPAYPAPPPALAPEAEGGRGRVKHRRKGSQTGFGYQYPSPGSGTTPEEGGTVGRGINTPNKYKVFNNWN